jgi:hypothetical protein
MEHCARHLNGNWLLTTCLWGRKVEESKPVILISYETKKESWVDPSTLWEDKELDLILKKDTMEYYAGSDYQEKVKSGCVIGKDKVFGTFGGYLQSTESGEIRGLTCGHICEFKYNKKFQPLEIEQPPSCFLEEIEADNSFSKVFKRLAGYTVNPVPSEDDLPFGSTTQGEILVSDPKAHTFDWALIDVLPHRHP